MGVARERRAIVEGLQKTVGDFSASVKGTSAKDVMDLMLITQYFDTIRTLGKKQGGATLFLPHGPDSVHAMRDKLRDSFISGFGADGIFSPSHEESGSKML